MVLRLWMSCVVVVLMWTPMIMSQGAVDLGVNLDDAGAFVNIINHTNRYSNASGYDADGWPTSDFSLVVMDGRPVAEWAQTIDDPEQYRIDRSGRYLASFTGRAELSVSGTAVSIENVSYDAPSNTTSFDLVVGGRNSANHGLVILQCVNTQRTAASAVGTGIANLVINRPGYPRITQQVFTDEYLALCRAADFVCYRTYNVQNIWDGEPTYPAVTRWEQRKTPADASQRSMAATSGKRDGWCWEYVISLANTLRKDIWICVHMSCDSDYVMRLAQVLKDDLDPTINIYVENSNEVWSPTQATHGPYNQAMAQARGITFDEAYAHRSVQLSQWFGRVFGTSAINERVRVILAGQHAYHGRSDNHLRYIQRTFGPPRDHIYATSTALYFGSTRGSVSDPEAINQGMLEDIDGQIGNSASPTFRPTHIAKAAEWNLKGGCTSYEGGPHVPAGGGDANLGAQIQAHRTARMADVIKRNYREGWQMLNGGLAMYFTLTSGYNRYGCWGLTDDPSNPDRNHKMQAMRDLLGQSTAVRQHDVRDDVITASIDHTRSALDVTWPVQDRAWNSATTVQLYDLLGMTLMDARLPDADRFSISIPRLSMGLYVVRIGPWTRIVSMR